jgi:hypothetical protein
MGIDVLLRGLLIALHLLEVDAVGLGDGDGVVGIEVRVGRALLIDLGEMVANELEAVRIVKGLLLLRGAVLALLEDLLPPLLGSHAPLLDVSLALTQEHVGRLLVALLLEASGLDELVSDTG